MKKNNLSNRAVPRPGYFDPGLLQRAADFLARPITEELQPNYLAGSVADRLIASCARNEGIYPDLLELGELACGEYDEFIAGARTPELRTYYASSRDLLREIIDAGE